MFKNPKISKKHLKPRRDSLSELKRKKVAKHLAQIKLNRRRSFGSMMEEISFKYIEE